MPALGAPGRRRPHVGGPERDGDGAEAIRDRGDFSALAARVSVEEWLARDEPGDSADRPRRAPGEDGNGEDFVLVDALAPMSYARSHLPGAINLPLSSGSTSGRRGGFPSPTRRSSSTASTPRAPARAWSPSGCAASATRTSATTWRARPTGLRPGSCSRAARSFSNDQAERHARLHPGRNEEQNIAAVLHEPARSQTRTYWSAEMTVDRLHTAHRARAGRRGALVRRESRASCGDRARGYGYAAGARLRYQAGSTRTGSILWRSSGS